MLAGKLEVFGEFTKLLDPVLLQILHQLRDVLQLQRHLLQLLVDEPLFGLKFLDPDLSFRVELLLCQLQKFFGRSGEGLKGHVTEARLYVVNNRIHVCPALFFALPVYLVSEISRGLGLAAPHHEGNTQACKKTGHKDEQHDGHGDTHGQPPLSSTPGLFYLFFGAGVNHGRSLALVPFHNYSNGKC